MRVCTVAEDCLACRQLDQLKYRDDDRDLRVWPSGSRVEVGGVLRARDIDFELIDRSKCVAAVMQVELQGITHSDRDALGRRSHGRFNGRDVDRGKLVLNALRIWRFRRA